MLAILVAGALNHRSVVNKSTHRRPDRTVWDSANFSSWGLNLMKNQFHGGASATGFFQPPSRPRAGWPIALLLGIHSLGAGAALTTVVGTGNQWTSHGGALDGTHYSELAQINRTSIGTPLDSKLVLERTFKTGVNGSHMGAPLVVGSTLYVVTPFPNKLIAYDLSSGATLWTFSPSVNRYAFGVNCCDTVNRGPAYQNGLVVYTTLDDTVVAVDVATHKQKWRTSLADPKTGVTTNGAVLIVPNKAAAGKYRVIVGSSSGEMAVRGWVKSLDLATGAVQWTAYTTGPDSDVKVGSAFYNSFYQKGKNQGVDQGVTSWEGAGNKWQQGGSSVWGFINYDAATDLLFYGTSQPGTWNADQRPGANKWGASVFARNASTGLAQWIYQTTPHDYWDYDAASGESVPLTLTTPITNASGSHAQVLVHFNKNGFAYTFDRLSGEVLAATKFGPKPEAVNWADHIDLATGLPVFLDAKGQVVPDSPKATHQGVPTTDICPSAMGLKGWEPMAFSPRTNLFYVPTFNLCQTYEGLKAEYIAGAPFMGQNITMTLGPGGLFSGELVAWDITSNTRKWAYPEPAAIYSGVLATQGDVIFYGTLDNKFKALDAITGDLLFETALTDANGYECGTVGTPITFMGPDKQQRVAVFSGVGWLAGGFTASGKPCPGKTGSESGGATNGGGRVHVFKLNP